MRPYSQSILVADDDEDIRVLVRDALLSRFPLAKVIEVKNGSDALMKLENQHFDLVITDYEMPRANGLVVATEITRMPPLRKPRGVITISGRTLAKERLTDIEYLQKPFDVHTLLD